MVKKCINVDQIYIFLIRQIGQQIARSKSLTVKATNIYTDQKQLKYNIADKTKGGGALWPYNEFTILAPFSSSGLDMQQFSRKLTNKMAAF